MSQFQLVEILNIIRHHLSQTTHHHSYSRKRLTTQENKNITKI